MGQKIKKPQQGKSIIKQTLEELKNRSVNKLNNDGYFLFSLLHKDKTQGQTFQEWENEKILSGAMDVLQGYSTLTTNSSGSKFTVYGNFPKRSDFTHPTQVPPDANWARIHINGTQILAGHIVNNVFYLVFLDKNHRFYITE